VVLIARSARDLPTLNHAWRAIAIFVVAVGFAASGVVPIVVATLSGAVAMVVSGVLSAREGLRAIDAKVAMTIVAALALGVALLETGGAAFVARGVVEALGEASPATVLSFFFLLVAVLANVISTKTCAVLFTPIGIDIAARLGVSPEAFAVAVVFAANCSFASPLGYQTNFLVMAPGRYRFMDFARAGLPLIVVLWIAFSLFAPWYYGL
jgi:di/tricarboxylate transporter